MRNKNFLERLQAADETVKRRWLIAGTIFAMAIVIFVWLAYFNTIIEPIPQFRESPAEAHGFSLWQTAKNGTALLLQTLSGFLRFLGAFLATPKDIIIEPPL